MVMYQRARKLGTLRTTPEEFLAISELQLEAYAVSINSLSLIDEKSAWFTLPIMSPESKLEVRPKTHGQCFVTLITRDSPENAESFPSIFPRIDMPLKRVIPRL